MTVCMWAGMPAFRVYMRLRQAGFQTCRVQRVKNLMGWTVIFFLSTGWSALELSLSGGWRRRMNEDVLGWGCWRCLRINQFKKHVQLSRLTNIFIFVDTIPIYRISEIYSWSCNFSSSKLSVSYRTHTRHISSCSTNSAILSVSLNPWLNTHPRKRRHGRYKLSQELQRKMFSSRLRTYKNDRS